MAYDKVIDSTFLDDGLTAIADKIREKGGTTDTLAFPNDFVTAIDAIEGGGEAEKQTMKKYTLSLSGIYKSTGNSCEMADWINRAYYKSVVGDGETWQMNDGFETTAPADVMLLSGVYDIRNMSSNELWLFTSGTSVGYTATYDVIDLTKLESAEKTLIGEATEDYPSGTYVFEGGNIYYYTAETSSGGGGETVMHNVLYQITPTYTTQNVSSAGWQSKTWYKSYYSSDDGWVGVDGILISALVDIVGLTGRYCYDSSENKMYYCPSASTDNYSPTMYVYDMSVSLDTYEQTAVDTHDGEYPIGTYEAKDGKWYYYGEEKISERELTERDVNFYDYDGLLLHSYTLGEVQTLSELPPLPTRDGLICQEWNWTLDELKALGRPMTVGATYITDDGATRLYLDIPNDARKTVPLYFSQSVTNGVTINWGDGSATETVSGTGYISTSHTYAEGGEYMISLMPSDTCNIILGNGTDRSIIGATKANTDYYKGSLLISANIGKNVTLGKCAFEQSVALKKISMPSTTKAGTARSSAFCFERCYALGFTVLSRANTFIGSYLFQEAIGLNFVSLPPTITGETEGSFAYCKGLKHIDLPDGVEGIGWAFLRECTPLNYINKAETTVINDSACRNATSLKRAAIGEGQKSINYTFDGCYALSEVDIPSTITSLNSSAFSNCYGMTRYDFTKCTTVPTLGNTNVFTGIPEDCIIAVPDNLLTTWKAATNWSTYSSYIKGASQV